ncbi:MAG: energy transducer TonB, partial [Bacteroidota bacterium]|nr:energy transducer TonB [Bacteroidota bacterium]
MKKSEKANLENKKIIFFQIGLLFSIALVLVAFEWSGTKQDYTKFSNNTAEIINLELPPITRRKEIKPPPPVIPSESFVIKKIEINDENELLIFETEATEDTEIITKSFFEQKKEESDNEIFMVVEDMPSFMGGGLRKFWQYVQ